MTTENDFQTALDASLGDWQTRLVFADWLEENGDPRAEGYRALGVNRKCPQQRGRYFLWFAVSGHHLSCPNHLPVAWFDHVAPGDHSGFMRFDHDEFSSRRDAENAAALAFGRLPASRRSELLAKAEAV